MGQPILKDDGSGQKGIVHSDSSSQPGGSSKQLKSHFSSSSSPLGWGGYGVTIGVFGELEEAATCVCNPGERYREGPGSGGSANESPGSDRDVDMVSASGRSKGSVCVCATSETMWDVLCSQVE